MSDAAQTPSLSEPVAWRFRYGSDYPWMLADTPSPQWAADHSDFEEEPLYIATPSAEQIRRDEQAKLILIVDYYFKYHKEPTAKQIIDAIRKRGET